MKRRIEILDEIYKGIVTDYVYEIAEKYNIKHIVR
tara:strand:- start:977 stop:1081 length:105 start_codon:yes stop_codon:yes gene_type:complete